MILLEKYRMLFFNSCFWLLLLYICWYVIFIYSTKNSFNKDLKTFIRIGIAFVIFGRKKKEYKYYFTFIICLLKDKNI